MSPEQAEAIVQEFGGFLATRQPNISDESLLPRPKNVILAALIMQEKAACDLANSLSKKGDKKRAAEIHTYQDRLGACNVTLRGYSKIETEDLRRVHYFNRYRSILAVPEPESREFMRLKIKYMSKEDFPPSGPVFFLTFEKALYYAKASLTPMIVKSSGNQGWTVLPEAPDSVPS